VPEGASPSAVLPLLSLVASTSALFDMGIKINNNNNKKINTMGLFHTIYEDVN
jgi:hypothetical protein